VVVVATFIEDYYNPLAVPSFIINPYQDILVVIIMASLELVVIKVFIIEGDTMVHLLQVVNLYKSLMDHLDHKEQIINHNQQKCILKSKRQHSFFQEYVMLL
jgi:hypothetical protein